MRGSIDDIIQGLQDYKKSLRAKADALVKALAEAGCEAVTVTYAGARYTGPRDEHVTVEERGPGKYAIVASGQTVLFVEFGAGVTLGGGHPEAEAFGYGPTTYPGQIHAADPNGWYLPKSATGKSGVHTYGNAPSAAMYHTAKSLRAMLEQAAKAVFGS